MKEDVKKKKEKIGSCARQSRKEDNRSAKIDREDNRKRRTRGKENAESVKPKTEKDNRKEKDYKKISVSKEKKEIVN